MRDEIYDIVNEECAELFCSLEKIRAAARNTHYYLEYTSDPSNKSDGKAQHDVFCMLSVIEDITNIADNQLSAATDKLCAICCAMEETP